MNMLPWLFPGMRDKFFGKKNLGPREAGIFKEWLKMKRRNDHTPGAFGYQGFKEGKKGRRIYA